MPKKVKFESFKYRFLIAAQGCSHSAGAGLPTWEDFIRSLEFVYEKGGVHITWKLEIPALCLCLWMVPNSIYVAIAVSMLSGSTNSV